MYNNVARNGKTKHFNKYSVKLSNITIFICFEFKTQKTNKITINEYTKII